MKQPAPGLRQIVLDHLRHSKGSVTLAAFSMLALAATDLLRPWPLKLILDYVLLDHPVPEYLQPFSGLFATQKTAAIIAISGAIVAIAALRGAFAYLQSYHSARFGAKLAFLLRNALFAHMQRLSLQYHFGRRTGELMTRIAGDAATIKSFISDSALTLGSHAVMIAATFTVMFLLNWQLALVVLATFPLLVWNMWSLHHRARVAAREQRQQDDRVASRINEVLASVHLVQAFGRERYEQERFEDDNEACHDQSVKNARIESTAARSVEVTTALGTCAVVLYGSMQVLHGTMTPGTILVFTSYLHGLYRPIRRLVKIMIRFSRLQVSVQRISELLAERPAIEDRPDAVDAQHVRGEISFEHVCFAYSAERGNVLNDLTFHVRPGRRIAIMGASGAGKSTIIGLILRLYEPQSGRITLDGVDLRDYQCESLRGRVAVVLQDSVLRGATVFENIAYGNLHASKDQVIAAAKAAHAHDFIMQLERGYETVIGERGARLSGGQKRRLAIARALVRNAPILILDEPLTGLDSESCRQVQAGLETLMEGRTCLAITHDARIAAESDHVIVLDHGRVAESGPPSQLLDSDGRFARWYDRCLRPGDTLPLLADRSVS